MGKYDDIISLPHHVSSKHQRMPISDRAAQFMPFAALSGHAPALAEAARLTEDRIDLDEDQKAQIDFSLRLAMEQTDSPPDVSITYFLPDTKKTGGSYVTVTGKIKKISEDGSLLYLTDGTQIPITDTVSLRLNKHL